MNETLEEIRKFRTEFEEFENKNESSHMLLLLHISRDAYNSDSSDTTGETLGLLSLWMGLISLFIVALLEEIIPPLIGKYLLIGLIFLGLFILIFNFRLFLNSKKRAKEINSFIEEITSDYRNLSQ